MVDMHTTQLEPVWVRVVRIVGGRVSSAILISLLLGVAVVAFSGSGPIDVFSALLTGAVTESGPRNTLARAVPICGMALAFSIPYRAGVINLGGQGQMVLGGLVGSIVAINAPGPDSMVLVVAIVAGAATGAAWAAFAALGQWKLMLPILITTLLGNYIADAISGYLIRYHVGDPGASEIAMKPIPLDRRVPTLPILGGVTVAVVVLIVAVIVISIHDRRRVSGYESLMTGYNPSFAWYGGLAVDRQRSTLLIIGGAIGGAVGANLIVGQLFVNIHGDIAGTAFAWTGLMVALIAPRNPIAIAIAALGFAGLQVGGLAMQRETGVPGSLALVLQGIIIVVFMTRLVFVRSTWAPRRRTMSTDTAQGSIGGGKDA